VPSLIIAALSLAFIPRSCRVSVKPSTIARRASPSTNATRPPSFPSPRCHPLLTVIPAHLLLPDSSPVLCQCSTRRLSRFPSTGEPLSATPPRRPSWESTGPLRPQAGPSRPSRFNRGLGKREGWPRPGPIAMDQNHGPVLGFIFIFFQFK
jgi:hypothetical protein